MSGGGLGRGYGGQQAGGQQAGQQGVGHDGRLRGGGEGGFVGSGGEETERSTSTALTSAG